VTTGHVFIATSLDGYIARRDHQLDWLMKYHTAEEDHGYTSFMDSVDGLVMGRGTYETVLSFGDWPYPKPVVVMSKTLVPGDIPDRVKDKVRLTDLDPVDLMESLEQDGWSRAYIDGGSVIQSFIRRGLIDDFILTTVPILIGDGIRLFGEIDKDVDLEYVETKSFKSGLVQARYRIKGRE